MRLPPRSACLVLLLGLWAAGAHAAPDREGRAFLEAEAEAEALARAERTTAAAQAFASLARRARTPDGRARALLRRAEVLRRGNRPREAYEAWKDAERRLAGTPASVRAAYHAAVVAYEDLGRKDEALAVFREIVDAHPGAIQAPRALHRLAWERPAGLLRTGYYLELYRSLGASPLGPELLWRCAKEAEAAHLGPTALGCLSRLVTRHPESGLQDRALLRAARLAASLNRTGLALSLYRRLLLRPPPPPSPLPFAGPPPRPPRRTSLADEALYGYGIVQADLAGDPGAAAAAFRTLVREHPTSRLVDDALRRLARLEAARGRPERARRAWRRLLELRPASRFAGEARAALP